MEKGDFTYVSFKNTLGHTQREEAGGEGAGGGGGEKEEGSRHREREGEKETEGEKREEDMWSHFT